MGKNNYHPQKVIPLFILLSFLFWLVRIVFLYSHTETTFSCEWRVGNIAYEIINGPLVQWHNFLNYTCSGITDAWQIIEGILLIPFFIAIGETLLSSKILSVVFSYAEFCGWYLFIQRFISQKAALIFSILFIFCQPFFLEGSSFLSGPQVQANVFIPYIFLILNFIVYDEKNKNILFILIGVLTGLGVYFNFLYYSLLFFFVSIALIAKNPFNKKNVLYLVSFFVITTPFYLYLGIKRDISGFGRGNIFEWILPNLSNQPEMLIERIKFIIIRYYETFTYQTSILLGSILFSTMLLSLILPLISRQKINKVLYFPAIFFVLLNVGRLLSRFDISAPINGLFWDGSGRYFIFGFGIILLYLSYFLSAIRVNIYGKVVSNFLLFCMILPSLVYNLSNFDFRIKERIFTKGYNYQDIGRKLFFWSQKDFYRAWDIIYSKREKDIDRIELVKGLINTALHYHLITFDQQDLKRLVNSFTSESFSPHAPFFFKAIGKNVCLEFNQNPMGLVQKLKEIQLLSGDNFSNTIEGVKEKFIEMKLFHHKDPNVGIIKVWKKDYAFLIKAIQQRENKGKINSIFIKPNEIFREDIMKYYYRHVINSLSNREFGSIYKIKQKMKNNKNFQQKIFFEELNNIYAPIYGKNVVRNILGN